jgi:hypothetical protein
MSVQEFINKLLQITQSQGPALLGQNVYNIPTEAVTLIASQTDINQAISIASEYVPFTIITEALSSGYGASASFDPLNPEDSRARAMLGLDTPQYLGIVDENYVPPKGADAKDFYYANDAIDYFRGKSPDVIADIQADLVNIGYLSPGQFVPGLWGEKDAVAMTAVLKVQNTLGVPAGKKATAWEEAMEVLLNTNLPTYQQEQVYLPPDYAKVANSINTLFSNELGREPEPYELQLLASQYSSDSKAKFMQQEELKAIGAEPEFVTGEELLAGTYGNHAITEVGAKIEEEGLTAIDPSARLYETFRNITEKERERLGRSEDIQKSNQLILNSITTAPWR